MTHLIKLELKKFGIAQNIIFMFAAILFSILFITISLWDSMTDPKQVKWQREELKEYVGNKGFCVVGVTLVKGKPLSECVLVAKKSID